MVAGELREKRWAIISFRGCEALGLDYPTAVNRRRELASEKISGLCIVSDEAARHLAPAQAARPKASATKSATKAATPRRAKA